MNSKIETKKKTSSINSEKKASTDNITQTKLEKKVFVHPLNSIYGHSFCETLKMQMGNSFTIVGTLDANEDSECPTGCANVIESKEKNALLAVLMECDIISFELLKTEVSLLEEVLNFFEKNIFVNQKELILISHPLIWYETVSQQMADLDNSDIFNEEDLIKEKKKSKSSEKLNSDLPLITDNDFFLRRTLPCFEVARLLENRVYYLKDVNPNVFAKIILPGIMYGRGEDDFYFMVEKILEEQPVFQIYGNGQNFIPIVHVMALAEKIVLLISLEHKDQRFFVFNQTEILKQQQIVELFSEFTKNGKILENNRIESMVCENYELMTINLKLENSHIFQMKQNSASSHSLLRMNSTNQSNNPFSSFKNNFKNNVLDFLKFRDISFKRLIIVGPEKILEDSELLSLFSNENKCTVVRINNHIKAKYLNKNKSESELEIQKDIESAIQKEKNKLLAEQADVNNKKKTKKNATDSIVEDTNLDFSNFLPNELLLKILDNLIVKGELNLKNYVLVQFPRRIDFLEEFHKLLSAHELQHNLQVFCFNFNPELVTKKIAEQEILVKNNPKADQMKEELENMKQSLEVFTPFSKKLTSEVLRIGQIEFESAKINSLNVFQNITKGLCEFHAEDFVPKTRENLQEKVQEIEIEKPQINGEISQLSSFKNDGKKEKVEQEFKRESREIDPISEEETILNFKCLSIKQYLNDNVLPELTEGIVEICSAKPENPVQYLIDFLKKKQTVV